MKTSLGLSCLLGMICLASCCSRDQAKRVVGRWGEVGSYGGIVFFHEDGTLELSNGPRETPGRFSFIAPNKLRLEFTGKEVTLAAREYEVLTLSGGKMTVKDVNGDTLEFERLKR